MNRMVHTKGGEVVVLSESPQMGTFRTYDPLSFRVAPPVAGDEV